MKLELQMPALHFLSFYIAHIKCSLFPKSCVWTQNVWMYTWIIFQKYFDRLKFDFFFMYLYNRLICNVPGCLVFLSWGARQHFIVVAAAADIWLPQELDFHRQRLCGCGCGCRCRCNAISKLEIIKRVRRHWRWNTEFVLPGKLQPSLAPPSLIAKSIEDWRISSHILAKIVTSEPRYLQY
jgi:hypothetical protein